MKRLPKTWKKPDLTEEKTRKVLSIVAKEIKLNYKHMIDFIFFYNPKGKFDKGWHLFEVVLIYTVVYFAILGIRLTY